MFIAQCYLDMAGNLLAPHATARPAPDAAAASTSDKAF